jgi:hypothetical protein
MAANTNSARPAKAPMAMPTMAPVESGEEEFCAGGSLDEGGEEEEELELDPDVVGKCDEVVEPDDGCKFPLVVGLVCDCCEVACAELFAAD